MRFPRSSLLARLAGVDASGFVLLEAPSGFGKSWLIRRAAPAGALRARGDLTPLRDIAAGRTPSLSGVIVDDAHLLGPADIDRLVAFIEDAADDLRLIVSGRFLPDAVHEVAHLVDGLIVDAAALSISAEEIVAQVPNVSQRTAVRISEAAAGSVRVISTALDQFALDSSTDPVVVAHQLVRAGCAAVLQQLSSSDAEMVGLMARAPGVDRFLLDKLGGPGFVDRAVAAGAPLRRQIAGGIELGNQAGYRTSSVDSAAAVRLATELIDRGRPLEAVGLLIDAGAHDRAARMLADLPDSVVDTVEPRVMLAVLARLGGTIDADASLLLLRASASKRSGRLDRSGADIDRALAMVGSTDNRLRRRLLVEHAERLWFEGRSAEAEQAAAEALRALGAGEDRTLAAAHTLLAQLASASDNRHDLQRAAEEYRIAIAAWEGCGELARARRRRRDLAMAVFVPLGRFDEALTQLNQLLAVNDLSDIERTWLVLSEGFVLYNANRLETAEARLARVTDIGQMHDDPQLIATAAWGRALVASRREDTHAALRWVSVAENTALGDTDDLLGVPFLCDVTTALGGLGELDIAARYLAKARERSELYTDQVVFAEFVLEARRGRLGDVDAQLARTPPAEWWRVQLVSAYATGRAGDLDVARRLLEDAERELVALGFSDFRSLGERAVFEELQVLLQGAATVGDSAQGASSPRISAAPVGRRLVVMGSPMSVYDTDRAEEVPAGNPQRLVGAVVAHGGSATFDQLSEAIWPGEDVEISRARLRNVLLRLRRGAGNVVVRSGSGVRLAPDVTCDLHDFERLASDALAASRSDPELAGHLAGDALRLVEGQVFADFEYEEWAIAARRAAEHQLIGLLDLLSVQAEDAGDLPLAQALAERALRLDRYSDSRYVRLAELMTLQGRNAAAVAVLEDAAEVARELGGALPAAVTRRRDDLIRRTATS